MPQPLRILHLISSLDPAGGGPSEGLRQIMACYQRLGAIPGIVTQDRPDAPWLDIGHAQGVGLGPGGDGTFAYQPRVFP